MGEFATLVPFETDVFLPLHTNASMWQLTPEQRDRLRDSVDTLALERLLDRLPTAAEQQLMLLSFYRNPTAAETADALGAAGVDDAELEDLRALADHTPLPPHLAHPENDFDPDWVAPTQMVTLALHAPDDPELRELWEAVEPRRGA
jgi:hypothetical protein